MKKPLPVVAPSPAPPPNDKGKKTSTIAGGSPCAHSLHSLPVIEQTNQESISNPNVVIKLNSGNNSTLHGVPKAKRRSKHPMTRIDNRAKDAVIILSFMPDVGPTSGQMVEIPHVEVCKSRTPHHFLEPAIINGPTNTNLVDVINETLSPAKGSSNEPHRIISCNGIDLSNPRPSPSGSKKRKAQEVLIPVVNSNDNPSCLSPDNSTKLLPPIEITSFSTGTSAASGSSSSRKRQGKKPRASWKNGIAGLGIGCFDCALNSWSWFAKSVKANSAIEGEVHTILWALQIGTSLNCQTIAIASDAQMVINALDKKLFPPCWEAKALVEDIRLLSCHFNEQENK
ncbi:hypothetical protein G4B88_016073 [Cannabis sativa]|uniref:RNase H type-1 domain-containing protein n=1 Tax=Cannabis sativa TaxID=3483 RepID=A0A7J6EXW2_CANSA|nr:hypothetical protein G4B88_016073 [Cannabis sativa]